MPRIIPRLIPVAALIFGIGCGQDTGSEAAARQATSETDDVAIASCGTDSFGAGNLAAQLAVTNDSSKRSNYTVEVVFESFDGATQYGSGLVFVENVEPGQATTAEALSTDPVPQAEFGCRLVSVERTSDVG